MGLQRLRTQNWLGNWSGKGRKALALAALALATAVGTMLVQARSPQPSLVLPGSTVASVAASDLPVNGVEVLGQIRNGGPFRYERDGVVFGNRERQLPNQKRGYYREYTVPTPGLGHRGARRIVCGGRQPKQPDACFYTDDHYASFRLIVQ